MVLKKFLWAILIISVIIQFITSFIYSNQIINENYQYNLYQTQKEALVLKVDELQNQLSRLTSLDTLTHSPEYSNLIPVTQTLDLNSSHD